MYNKTVKRSEVKVWNDVGEDRSIIDFGDCEAIFSTDPITGAEKNIGIPKKCRKKNKSCTLLHSLYKKER